MEGERKALLIMTLPMAKNTPLDPPHTCLLGAVIWKIVTSRRSVPRYVAVGDGDITQEDLDYVTDEDARNATVVVGLSLGLRRSILVFEHCHIAIGEH